MSQRKRRLALRESPLATSIFFIVLAVLFVGLSLMTTDVFTRISTGGV